MSGIAETGAPSPPPAGGGPRPQGRPLLLFFYGPASGRSRLAEGWLATILQRNHNHETFDLRRIDVTRRPDLARRFDVQELPVLCVVDGNAVVARLDAPRGGSPIKALLSPWLRGAVSVSK